MSVDSKEFFVTKLSFREDGKLIKNVFAYEYDGELLSEGVTQDRQWMVDKVKNGSSISFMTPNPKESDKWVRGKPYKYKNGLFSWEKQLPNNLTKRKTFISYYHNDDQEYKEKFKNLFGDLIVNKSVEYNDIDSDNSDEYIKQLIQNDYLADTTVLVVLIGEKTKCRKHIDWEIAGALNLKVGDSYSGLLGLFLPNHPNFGSDKYTSSEVPKRLAQNIKSGYAIAKDWTEDRVKLQEYVESAFEKRAESDKIINKAIPQMNENTCD
jgi:hypothetical protein